MNFTLNIGSTITIKAAPEDPADNPGLIDAAPPGWAASPAAGISVTPAPDGLSAAFGATVPGVYNITVSAQVPSAATISGQFTVTVLEQNASQFVFSQE